MGKTKETPSMEQWKELYEIAQKIRLQSPWERLWDTDFIVVELPERSEPILISVMGKSEVCFGIGVYPGYRSMEGLYRLMEASEGDLNEPLAYQSCLMCYYGNRDELMPKERALIKKLNLSYRGKNEWIYFRSMEEGQAPWFLDGEQAALMIQVLQNFLMVFEHLAADKCKVDFGAGEILLRHYSPQQKEWLNIAVPMPPIPEIRQEVTFQDELLLARLKNSSKNQMSLEMDLLYLPMPIQESPGTRPYFPCVLALFDRESGMLVGQRMLGNGEKSEDAIVNMLVQYIQDAGMPEHLFVRDPYFYRYVVSLCTQVALPVTHSEGMECADDFLAGMLESF